MKVLIYLLVPICYVNMKTLSNQTNVNTANLHFHNRIHKLKGSKNWHISKWQDFAFFTVMRAHKLPPPLIKQHSEFPHC